MKKVLTILGAIFICLIVVGVIFFSGIYYYASRLDREAKAYIKVELLFNTLSNKIGQV